MSERMGIIKAPVAGVTWRDNAILPFKAPSKPQEPRFRLDWEKGGKEAFHGPRCSCTSRNQISKGAGVWECRSCGAVNHYRQTVDGYLPFTREVAAGIDELRRGEL